MAELRIIFWHFLVFNIVYDIKYPPCQWCREIPVHHALSLKDHQAFST
jgi:hypothetical protein